MKAFSFRLMPARRRCASPTRPGFALVLALLLVVLLTAVANGLALTAATESLSAAHTASMLDHELAIDSFLVAFPYLLETEQAGKIPVGTVELRLLEFQIGDVAVRCLARPHSAQLAAAGETAGGSLPARLRELASSKGLPIEDIVLEPILPAAIRETSLPAFLWFDQLVRPTQFEEILHWGVPAASARSKFRAKTAWSDLVTFWSGGRYALTVVTSKAGQTRRWFVVAAADGRMVSLYRGPA